MAGVGITPGGGLWEPQILIVTRSQVIVSRHKKGEPVDSPVSSITRITRLPPEVGFLESLDFPNQLLNEVVVIMDMGIQLNCCIARIVVLH